MRAYFDPHLRLCCSEIRLPPASECDLYYVNRDTLFSYHKDSELFLQVKPDLLNDVGWVVINIFTCLNAVTNYLYSYSE